RMPLSLAFLLAPSNPAAFGWNFTISTRDEVQLMITVIRCPRTGGGCSDGGMSIGPRTAEGRARIAEAQRRRWKALGAARSCSGGPGTHEPCSVDLMS